MNAMQLVFTSHELSNTWVIHYYSFLSRVYYITLVIDKNVKKNAQKNRNTLGAKAFR